MHPDGNLRGLARFAAWLALIVFYWWYFPIAIFTDMTSLNGVYVKGRDELLLFADWCKRA